MTCKLLVQKNLKLQPSFYNRTCGVNQIKGNENENKGHETHNYWTKLFCMQTRFCKTLFQQMQSFETPKCNHLNAYFLSKRSKPRCWFSFTFNDLAWAAVSVYSKCSAISIW